jgi:hypothetical protein
VSSEVDPRLTALAMLSMLNATNTWYQPDKDTSGRPIGEVLAGLMIDGLANRPATSLGSAPAKKPAVTRTPAKKPAVTRTQAKKGTGAESVPLKPSGRRKGH